MRRLKSAEWRFDQVLNIGLVMTVVLMCGVVKSVNAAEGDNRICVGSYEGDAAIVMTSKSETPHCKRLSLENFNRTGTIDNWTDPTEGDRLKYCDDFSEYHNLTVNACDVLKEYLPIALDLFKESYSADSESVNSKWFGGEAIGPIGNSGCTSSFLLEKNGTKYVSTAGHCIGAPLVLRPLGGYWSDSNRNWEKESKIIGPATAYWFHSTPNYVTDSYAPDHYFGNDFYDVGLIEVVDEKTLRPYSQIFEFYRDNEGDYMPSGKVSITEFADPYVGMQVCLTGITTGTTCGEIIRVGSNSFDATVCAQSGDSGGPIYTRDGKAVGILSGHRTIGSNPDCANTQTAVGATISGLEDLGYSIAD